VDIKLEKKQRRNINLDAIVELMNTDGVFEMHRAKIATIMCVSKTTMYRLINLDKRFTKSNPGWVQLLHEYRKPSMNQVKIEPTPLEEPEKEIISTADDKREKSRSRPKMDLLVKYIEERNMTEIHVDFNRIIYIHTLYLFEFFFRKLIFSGEVLL